LRELHQVFMDRGRGTRSGSRIAQCPNPKVSLVSSRSRRNRRRVGLRSGSGSRRTGWGEGTENVTTDEHRLTLSCRSSGQASPSFGRFRTGSWSRPGGRGPSPAFAVLARPLPGRGEAWKADGSRGPSASLCSPRGERKFTTDEHRLTPSYGLGGGAARGWRRALVRRPVACGALRARGVRAVARTSPLRDLRAGGGGDGGAEAVLRSRYPGAAGIAGGAITERQRDAGAAAIGESPAGRRCYFNHSSGG
jgi:hypothetical protein